jgi:MerR family transcriptional regulator/heat shock protein HspR
MAADDRHGLYSIGVVARLTGLHEQTIRQYERMGLVTPQRSPGGTRIFADEDVRTLQSIANLTRDMGVNLAGVEIILKMRRRQQQLIGLAREMFSHLDDVSRARFESLIRGDEPGLVPTGDTGLARRSAPAESKKRRIPIEGEDSPDGQDAKK